MGAAGKAGGAAARAGAAPGGDAGTGRAGEAQRPPAPTPHTRHTYTQRPASEENYCDVISPAASDSEASFDDALSILNGNRSIHSSSVTSPITDLSASVDYSTAFFVPVTIGGVAEEQAYIDSGASHSGIDRILFDSLPQE